MRGFELAFMRGRREEGGQALPQNLSSDSQRRP